SFFVQRENLSTTDVRGGFTVILILSAVICGALALLAPWLADRFGDAGLCPYLWVASAVFMVEIFGQVLSALMQRDMAFNKMAATGIASQVVGGACTIVLGALGFSYMSFAWGWLTGTLVGVFAAASLRRDLRVFLPSLQGWRPMLAFGGYHG